jgi:hypothetical protein
MFDMYWKYAGTRYKHKFKAMEAARANLQAISFHVYSESLLNRDFTIEPPTPYKELLKQRALQLRDKYKFIKLYFSGGQDSMTMLNAFVENNIFIDQICIWLFGSENSQSNIEVNDYAIPYIKKHFEGTKTKITILKNEFDYYNEYLGEKWLHTRSSFSLRHYNIPNIRGKNFCNLFGILDPTVHFENGKYYHTLWDGEIDELLGFRNCECFFSSEDSFDLHLKQLHLVKNFIKFNHDKKHIFDLYNKDPETYLDVVKVVCRDKALFPKIYHKSRTNFIINDKDKIIFSELPTYLQDRYRYILSTKVQGKLLINLYRKTHPATPICLGE